MEIEPIIMSIRVAVWRGGVKVRHFMSIRIIVIIKGAPLEESFMSGVKLQLVSEKFNIKDFLLP